MAKSKAKPDLIRTILSHDESHRVLVYSLRNYLGTAHCTRCDWNAPIFESKLDAIGAGRLHCGLSELEPVEED